MNTYLKRGWRLRARIIVLLCLAFFAAKPNIDTVETREAAHSNQAVKTRLNETQMWVNLGDVCASEGRHEDAIQANKQAEKLNPYHPEIHNYLALIYQDLGRYEAAIESWKQVIKLKPGIAGLHVLLRDAYIKTGHMEEGILA